MAIFNLERGLPPEIKFCWHLDCELPSLQNRKNVCCLSHPLHGMMLQHPEQTNTGICLLILKYTVEGSGLYLRIPEPPLCAPHTVNENYNPPRTRRFLKSQVVLLRKFPLNCSHKDYPPPHSLFLLYPQDTGGILASSLYECRSKALKFYEQRLDSFILASTVLTLSFPVSRYSMCDEQKESVNTPYNLRFNLTLLNKLEV